MEEAWDKVCNGWPTNHVQKSTCVIILENPFVNLLHYHDNGCLDAPLYRPQFRAICLQLYYKVHEFI